MSSPEKTELEGRVAIVTGAGRMRGIGRAAALALARSGCDVVLTGTGRDPSTFPDDERQAGWRDVESVAEEVRALGGSALALAVNVADAAQVDDMVRQTVATFGRVDILVNNAAFPRGADRVPVVDLSEDLFRSVLEVKLVGAFLCSRAVARQLIAQGQGGAIVNLSSTAGRRGLANTAAYCAANFAIHGFTQSLALELAPHQVRVNAVCPGLIDTERNELLKDDDRWDRQVRSIPLGYAGASDDIAEAIRFLCSPGAAFITGEFINVNGGSVMQ